MATFWSGLPIPQRGESEIRKGPTSPGSEQPKIKQGIHEDSNKCFIIGFLLPPEPRTFFLNISRFGMWVCVSTHFLFELILKSGCSSSPQLLILIIKLFKAAFLREKPPSLQIQRSIWIFREHTHFHKAPPNPVCTPSHSTSPHLPREQLHHSPSAWTSQPAGHSVLWISEQGESQGTNSMLWIRVVARCLCRGNSPRPPLT